MKNKHRGSSLEDFLKGEGVFEECLEESVKRVVVFQLEQGLKKQKVSKNQFIRKIKTDGVAAN